MAYCTNCGQQLMNNEKFCSQCGTPVMSTTELESSRRNVVYEGVLHKCPNCGEVIDSFSVQCPSCGHELRGIKNKSSVQELSSALREIETTREPEKKNEQSGIKQYFRENFLNDQISSCDTKQVNLIKSFAIPNTKEDIMEFIILASSNINLKVYGFDSGSETERAISDAWLAKFEQAYRKAQLLFGGTPEFVNVQNLYEQKMKEIKRMKWQLPLFFVGVLVTVFGTLFFVGKLIGTF